MATACVKPYSIPVAVQELQGSSVLVCPVIGFPHGNSTTKVKVFEAVEAVDAGGKEIDMVINVGKALGGDWEYVADEIQQINNAVVKKGAILKVIFEVCRALHTMVNTTALTWHRTAIWRTVTSSAYAKSVRRLALLSSRHRRKSSRYFDPLNPFRLLHYSGYGFVKQPNGLYTYAGATLRHLRLMRQQFVCQDTELIYHSYLSLPSTDPSVQIKAAGGVRTLDDLLRVRALGVTRVGATAGPAMLEEAQKRGIGEMPTDVMVSLDGVAMDGAGGY